MMPHKVGPETELRTVDEAFLLVFRSEKQILLPTRKSPEEFVQQAVDRGAGSLSSILKCGSGTGRTLCSPYKSGRFSAGGTHSLDRWKSVEPYVLRVVFRRVPTESEIRRGQRSARRTGNEPAGPVTRLDPTFLAM